MSEEVTGEIVSWPLVISTLEQIGPWAPYAFRVGILQMIKWTTISMLERDAPVKHVKQLRELVDALQHMQWEDDNV
jgi:hypothetical protein